MVARGPLLDSIPDPHIVREHLGQALRTASILRRLLPVAESAAKERAEHSGGAVPSEEDCHDG